MVFKKGGGHVTKDEIKKPSGTTTLPAKPEKKAQVQKAFAIERTDKGLWIMHVYDIVDGKVTGVKSSEPEPKSLSVERFKLGFSIHYILGKN